MKKKLFIIAGEKSGDLLGSKILEKIDKLLMKWLKISQLSRKFYQKYSN